MTYTKRRFTAEFWEGRYWLLDALHSDMKPGNEQLLSTTSLDNAIQVCKVLNTYMDIPKSVRAEYGTAYSEDGNMK